MRTLALGLIFISIFQTAAQANTASVAHQQSKAEKDLLELDAQRETLAAIVAKNNNEAAAIYKKYYDEISTKRADLQKTNPTLDQNRYRQLEYDLAKLKENYEKDKANFDKLEAEASRNLKKVTADIETTKRIILAEGLQNPTTTSSAPGAPLATSARALPLLVTSQGQEIQALETKIEIQALEAQFEGADDKIDELERLYDRSQVGAYVQEKVSQLVNSITICRAMRRCAVKDEQPLDPKLIQEELFPESKATRSEHYQKVKTRRPPGSSQ
jgi:hypothetical protein